MENNLISIEDFCLYHKVEINFIQSLEEYDLIQTTIVRKSVFLQADDLDKIERYVRLYQQLDINLEGLHAVAHLLDKLENMQDEVRKLRNEIGYYKQLH